MRQRHNFLTQRRKGAKAQRKEYKILASLRLCVFALSFFFCVPNLMAQSITVSPADANVYSQGATSVFLTYSGLGAYRPAETIWCGALQPATPPAVGAMCNPTIQFGRLPARYDQSRLSGNANYTDIMSVTPAVARRAYLDAASGATATFFYVRRFTAPGQPDQFVAVTLRLTGNGAAAPLSLTNVTLGWGVNKSVLLVKAGEKLPQIQAEINYTGTGRLIGRWELVKPGEELPDNRDLLPEASLPQEERNLQRRYTQLTRFNIFLPPNGKITLPVPEAWRLDKSIEGVYLVLLRIEASDDTNSQSNVGPGLVRGGATAGFALPTLRYYVGSGGLTRIDNNVLASNRVAQLAPANNVVIALDQPLIFTWPDVERAAYYVLEITGETGQPVHSAVLMPEEHSYRAPSWLRARGNFSWRVAAYGPGRKLLQTTPPRNLVRQ